MSDLLISEVLPKSNVGRKAIPPKADLLEALVAAFNEATAEVLNSEGDLAPKVYGPAFLFESETKARTDAKRYVKALAETHGRKCTINVYPVRENYSAKILKADGSVARFVRVFGENPESAIKAATETLEEGETVAGVAADAKYRWRLYVPVSGEDGGRTEPLTVETSEDDTDEDED